MLRLARDIRPTTKFIFYFQKITGNKVKQWKTILFYYCTFVIFKLKFSLEQINHIVEVIAKWLEILGFLISLATGVKVFFVLDKRVKILQMKHLYTATISDHLATLRKTSRNISKLISSFPENVGIIRNEIIICSENCKNIKKKSLPYRLINLDALIKASNSVIKNRYDINKKVVFMLRIFGIRPVNQRDIENFYEILNALITEIELINRDVQKSI